MKNHKMTQAQIESLQNDANYVIGDNPISTAKFMRAISKGEYKPLSVKDTYTPKLFYEMVSRIKPQDLENIKINENIEIEIEVKKFAEAIGAINNNNFYNDIKNTAEYLSDIKVVFKTYDGFNTRVGLVSKTKTDEKGKITLYVDSELARKILDVKDNGNFSFLKSNVFVLQSGQAIKLYPFLKSWLNKGIYTTYPKDGKTGLETFKEQLGYNTSGYIRYNTFRSKVLEPAITEINEKTDINVSYQPTGDNLDSKKPRIDGLIFYIKAKDKIKQLAEQQQTPPKQDTQPEKPIVQKTAQSNEPSEAEIIVLGEKLKLSLIQIQTIIGELKGNHIRAFEVLQGCINEGKTKTINSNFAYIITSLSTLGIGLWQEQKEKKQKAELQKAEKEKQLFL
jgi:plasmid replication initiation protein